jgi:hypothetical protein
LLTPAKLHPELSRSLYFVTREIFGFVTGLVKSGLVYVARERGEQRSLSSMPRAPTMGETSVYWQAQRHARAKVWSPPRNRATHVCTRKLVSRARAVRTILARLNQNACKPWPEIVHMFLHYCMTMNQRTMLRCLLLGLALALCVAPTEATDSTSGMDPVVPDNGAMQSHRSLTGSFLSNLFIGNEPNDMPNVDCIRDEVTLRTKLENGGTALLCRGSTINMTSSIDITDLSFDLQCGSAPGTTHDRPRWPRFRRRGNTGIPAAPLALCTLAGNNQTRFFVGRPVSANFYDVVFQGGLSPESDAGGAIQLKDGTNALVRCTFRGNQGTVRCVDHAYDVPILMHLSHEKMLHVSPVWRCLARFGTHHPCHHCGFRV